MNKPRGANAVGTVGSDLSAGKNATKMDGNSVLT